jgi:hypothetical protein
MSWEDKPRRMLGYWQSRGPQHQVWPQRRDKTWSLRHRLENLRRRSNRCKAAFLLITLPMLSSQCLPMLFPNKRRYFSRSWRPPRCQFNRQSNHHRFLIKACIRRKPKSPKLPLLRWRNSYKRSMAWLGSSNLSHLLRTGLPNQKIKMRKRVKQASLLHQSLSSQFSNCLLHKNLQRSQNSQSPSLL